MITLASRVKPAESRAYEICMYLPSYLRQHTYGYFAEQGQRGKANRAQCTENSLVMPRHLFVQTRTNNFMHCYIRSDYAPVRG